MRGKGKEEWKGRGFFGLDLLDELGDFGSHVHFFLLMQYRLHDTLGFDFVSGLFSPGVISEQFLRF